MRRERGEGGRQNTGKGKRKVNRKAGREGETKKGEASYREWKEGKGKKMKGKMKGL